MRPVKRGVDLQGVEVAGEKLQRIESPRLLLRVHEPVPVLVAPAGRTDADHARHATSMLRRRTARTSMRGTAAPARRVVDGGRGGSGGRDRTTPRVEMGA